MSRPLPGASPKLPARTAAPAPLWVAIGLALGPAAVLGFGRFAYALLLPPMRADLGWSYAEAGTINAANALGYLLGALVAARAADRLGAKRCFTLGLLAAAVALLLSAATRDFTVLLALRLAAGVFGAVVFVSGGSLVALAGLGASPARAALLLAVYFSGPGLGILLSGPVVGLSMGTAAADWPAGWIAIGGAALFAAVASLPALRRAPVRVSRHAADSAFRFRPLAPMFVAYGLFGAGYIAYMTFIVAFLRTRGLDEPQIAVFWALLGAASVAAAFVWGKILGRLSAGRGIFCVLVVVLAGAVLPLLAPGPIPAFGSAILFGGSFLAVVTAVTHVARHATPPSSWTRVIGALTVAFALGQCLGPVAAGALSDSASGLRAGMLLSAALLACAGAVSLRQRDAEG